MIPKILIVDDYAYNRLVYGEWLRDIEGVEIVEAATPERALQVARTGDFAVLVIDVDLPGMDGCSLARRLRAEEGPAMTPILLVSPDARGCGSDSLQAMEFVAFAPLRGDVLQHKARVFVHLFRKHAALRERVKAMQREIHELQTRLEEAGRQQDDLMDRATHDVLTHLPNRALFGDRVRAAQARASRHRQMLALGYLDLDRFKTINDRYGHAVGDALLTAVGERLIKAVRATDTVARLGGDEFALLLEGLDSPGRAEYVADKVRRALAAPFSVRAAGASDVVQVKTGASIGLALYPDHGAEIDGLIFRADIAMYAAKQEGGGVRMYGDALRETLLPGEPRLRLVRGARDPIQRH